MPPAGRIAATTAVWIWTVGALPGAALARPVAIVNAASDGDAGARAAAEVRRQLDADPDLEPIDEGDLSRALEGAGATDAASRDRWATARRELDAARRSLDRFETARGLAAISRAEAILFELPGSDARRQILAAAAFLAGLCHMRANNRGLAERAFALAVRLDPSRATPDPARFPPEVIDAVARAGRPVAGRVPLSVSATFDGAAVEVDGRVVGRTPWRGAIAPGRHIVTVEAVRARPAGRAVDVDDAPIALRLDLPLLTAVEQAAALRLALQNTAELAVLGAVTDLARVGDAVVVLEGEDGAGPSVAIYQRSANRLSRRRTLAGLGGLLGVLVPLSPVGIGPALSPPTDGPWITRPLGIATVAGGAALAALLVVWFALDRGDGRRAATVDGFGP